ncbi:STAS domain-containing protein [Neoroseomonas soli]|uniref:STAS domain-containing protein n=1 Tax=Neoroseomonas soli TaxID=1081025 RepID=A0A9X9WSR9_9PROT|nr:STAS domain-containing protein [Neoroseomonas soli]MBR0670198.1 STAS domain-containing protein [Neoroseomonas soli]
MELAVVGSGTALLRLVLAGRLDAAGTEKVEGRFSAAIGNSKADVAVDLTGVSFVGSLGIRMLIAAARQADRARRRFVIFGAQSAVAEVFETVSLDDLIPVVADEDAALARLKA